MLLLSEDQLDQGFDALVHHRYGSFFPNPPEFDVIASKWPEVRQHLSRTDLDTYATYETISAFVPKSRLNVRWVSLLHPVDLIFYTSLVRTLRDDIAGARLSPRSRRVFSYRSEGLNGNELYTRTPSFGTFRKRLREKTKSGKGYVGVTDIADFYPRIYQHRLQNALEAALTDLSKKPMIRVLCKLLSQFSKGASYGIPVGPVASRPLGEAVLIDIDSALKSRRSDFYRYVDDFVVFAKSPELAAADLHFLAEKLYTNHGLTLQTAKTKLMSRKEYREKYLVPPSKKEKQRRELLSLVMEVNEEGDYEILPYSELNDEQRQELDAMNLSEMLSEALASGEDVDYKEVSFILGRLSALQKPELIPIVLENIERLYPVSHSVASFFGKFTNLPTGERKRIADRLLRPLLSTRRVGVPTYYAIWVLHLFHQNPSWDHADKLLRIFQATSSIMVRRYAALSLASCGQRAHALALKEEFRGAPPLLRSAILFATQKLGPDERNHWLRSSKISDPLERCLVSL